MLKFVNPYLSITPPFNDVDLPQLTVLTGKNGSGKSHLLAAIQGRNVEITSKVNPRITTFNYETFKLDNEAAFSSQVVFDEKQNAWNYFQTQQKQNFVNWRQHFQPQDIALIERAKADKQPFWKIIGSPQFQNYKTIIENHLRNPQSGNPIVHASLLRLARLISTPLDEITRETFIDKYEQTEMKEDFLPKTLGKIFWDYHSKKLLNSLARFRNQDEGIDLPCFTPEEFIEQFGEAPWLKINRIIADVSGLNYEVSTPARLQPFDSYQLKLVSKDNKDLSIDFINLSSGEHILMALVASIYTNNDFDRPDVLLLDELDATLHPSMIRSMIRVVQEEFVSKGITVLMVTHSPTTVALAPEDSVFVMHRNGSDRVTKSTRQEALKILTEGFVTLDDGLAVIREIFDNKLTIITEGRNVAFLEQYIELKGIKDVKVMKGLESKTGATQMKPVFDFLQAVPHSSKILFAWDSDVEKTFGNKVTVQNNTVPFFFSKNLNNRYAESGIENLFPEMLMEDMTDINRNPEGAITKQTFAKNYKVKFERRILSRAELSDYDLFESLHTAIKMLQGLPAQ